MKGKLRRAASTMPSQTAEILLKVVQTVKVIHSRCLVPVVKNVVGKATKIHVTDEIGWNESPRLGKTTTKGIVIITLRIPSYFQSATVTGAKINLKREIGQYQLAVNRKMPTGKAT